MSSKISLYDKTICERIKDLRSELKITGSEFAYKVGISQGYLSDIENANSSPKKTLLLAISYIYNLNYDWLLTGEGDEKGSLYNKEDPEDDLEISELLEEARKVLKSGDEVTHEALKVSIRYFSRAIDDLEAMKETKKRQKNMELRMASLEARIKKSEEIRKEDSPEQQDEILKLRTTG